MSSDETKPEAEEQEELASGETLKADSSDDLPGGQGEQDIGTSDTEIGDSSGGSDTAGASDSPSQDLTGKTLAGRYAVLEKIGSGGMSVVYLARHELLNKLVAIKVLRAEQALRKDSKARFHREAKAAASLGDPHIVDITDYGFTDRGDAFIVMERLEGSNLRATVAAEGALPVGRAVAIARQILRALRSAHDHGIIHRDLKAENVFLCQREGSDFVKLLDFGISKVTRALDEGDETGLTTTGQVLGTPQYLAPEQAHGIEHVDHRADIYAMGVILYEMLTGQLPFTGKSVFEVVMKHVQEAPQPPSERRPDLAIPAELERIVLRTLAKDPDERYQTAQEMLDALPTSEDLPGGYTSQSLTPAPRTTAPVRAVRRGRGAAVVAAVALAALLVGWIVLRQRTAPPPVAPPAAVPATDQRVPRPRPPDIGPAPDRAPDRLTVEVRAKPKTALIRINGKDTGTGSATARVPPGSTAVIEVSAPGHRPHREEVRVDKDTVIPVRLRRRHRGPRPAPKQNKGSGDLQQNPYR